VHTWAMPVGYPTNFLPELYYAADPSHDGMIQS